MPDSSLRGVWVVSRVQPTNYPRTFVSVTLWVGEKLDPPQLNPADFPLVRFFSNEHIRNVIRYSRVKPGFKLGTMSLSVDPHSRSMEWANYYPLDFVPSMWSLFNFSGKRLSKLRKAGIAQLSEYIVLSFVQKKFPFVEKVWHIDPRSPRVVQLNKRSPALLSDSPVFDYSLKDGLRFLREKIARDAWKHVPPKPGSRRARIPVREWSHQTLVRRRKLP